MRREVQPRTDFKMTDIFHRQGRSLSGAGGQALPREPVQSFGEVRKKLYEM